MSVRGWTRGWAVTRFSASMFIGGAFASAAIEAWPTWLGFGVLLGFVLDDYLERHL